LELVYLGALQLLLYDLFSYFYLMITLNEFTTQLELEFDDMIVGTLLPTTDYRTIKGWSSMHALIVIAFLDANFDILLTGADLKQTQTIGDLYNLVLQKK